MTELLNQGWVPTYPNLARHVKLTAVNQLWVADITFIRLRQEFVYLAVVLEAFPRRVIGWNLERTVHAGLAIGALQMALSQRRWKAEGVAFDFKWRRVSELCGFWLTFGEAGRWGVDLYR